MGPTSVGPSFRDRVDAGRQLASPLAKFSGENPLVLGLARGGVVVAAEIARALDAELDVLVVRKIGAPANPEFGIGAVAPLNTSVFDFEAMRSLNLTRAAIQPHVNRELTELSRHQAMFRPGRGEIVAANRTVILVDDGLATGITAVAAARYVKRLGASRIIFAAPVCSRPGSANLEPEVEEIVCLVVPDVFFAVGMWFEDFTQVEDREVLETLSGYSRREFLA